MRGNAIELTWEEAANMNINHYIVEQSRDVINWKEIEQAEGLGESAYSLFYRNGR